jgi:methyl-accepting chemotaxis protein
MFKIKTIKARTTAVLAILAGGYLLLFAMVQFTANATHSRMSLISSSLFPSAIKMQEAEASFERMKKHYGDVVVLQDDAALKTAEKDAEQTRAALANVQESLHGSPALAHQAEDLMARFVSLQDRDKTVYSAILASKGNPTDDQMASVGALAKDNIALTASMADLDKSISSGFQQQLDAVDAWSLRSRVAGMVMLAVAFLICGSAWWLLRVKVVAPLHTLAMRMQDIAEGDGDLTRRVETRGEDEIDEVGVWFNVFIGRVEDIVRQVTGHAGSLRASAAALAASAQEAAERSTQQQEEAARITATMSEISTSVLEISKNTQVAAADARKAEESAHAGGQTVQATVQTIGELLNSNQETSTRIEELGRSSNAIGKIINVIDEIAGQTNLLALNASIEAARAGEHGRGFAVVAGEVRRLAERTSAATKEIDHTVRAIQQGTSDAVEAMRSSMSHVESGVASARSAGQALSSIIHESESVQKMVTQIAAAATEQSYSTQSVSESVNQIANIIQQTAAGSQTARESCNDLASLATELSSLVGAFKVSSGAN